MKILQPIKGIFVVLWFLGSSMSLQATTENLTDKEGGIYIEYEDYINNIDNYYNINTNTYSKITFNFSYDLEWDYDYFLIYEISNDNTEDIIFDSRAHAGCYYGSVSTNIPTGRAKIVVHTDDYNCYDSGFSGLYVDYYTEPYTFNTSSLTNSNVTIAGNLGVGISNPATRLHIDGAIRGNEPGGALKVSTAFGLLTLGPQNSYYTDIITDRAYFKFNQPIYLTSGKLSTSYASTNLDFQIVGSTKMSLLSDGKFGIGTTSPKGRLNTLALSNATNMTLGSPTQPGLSVTSSDGGAYGMYFGVSNTGKSWIQGGRTDSATAYDILLQSAGGNVGIGTNNPSNLLDVRGQDNYSSGGHDIVAFANASSSAGVVSGWYANGTTATGGWTRSISSLPYFIGTTETPQALTILNNGFVGIGTTAPDKLFTVKGIIHAQEVQVDVTGFADYVFEKGYKLKPLSEIHSFISENGHLPEIPTEDEVKKNGMNVADMQVMLLKKIEELTLYAIQQQKRIEALEKTLKEK
ncbi:MAG TPA: hypothetical protein VFP20_05260 [Bacteroidales bacterium]|nr:hypothetical protein [Bacteroidales bacterium]